MESFNVSVVSVGVESFSVSVVSVGVESFSVSVVSVGVVRFGVCVVSVGVVIVVNLDVDFRLVECPCIVFTGPVKGVVKLFVSLL